ncbi:hypothetical protein M0P48_05705, partial [Candidatus Gracilibacteria bacterium]|nr:hypothetical protein [Candidatus Gracilibacteria bacterium]
GVIGTLMLNGKIGRDVDVVVQDDISVAYSAKVAGDFSYSSLIESTIPKNVVAGTLTFNKSDKKDNFSSVTSDIVTNKVVSYVSALIILALFCAFFKNYFVKASEFAKQNILKAMGIGIITIISCFVGGAMLLFTIVGVPLGLIAFVVGLLFLYLGKIFAAVWIGNYFGKFGKNKKLNELNLFLWSALGLLIYYVVGLVPIVGWVANAGAALVGIGVITNMKVEILNFLRSKKIV